MEALLSLDWTHPLLISIVANFRLLCTLGNLATVSGNTQGPIWLSGNDSGFFLPRQVLAGKNVRKNVMTPRQLQFLGPGANGRLRDLELVGQLVRRGKAAVVGYLQRVGNTWGKRPRLPSSPARGGLGRWDVDKCKGIHTATFSSWLWA